MQLEKKYYTVQDEETLKLLHQHIIDSDTLAVDTETTGLNPRKDKIIGWSVSGDEGIGFYLPTLVFDYGKDELVLQEINGQSTEVISKNLLKLLMGKKLVFHNASFDVQFIKNYFNVDLLPSVWVDTGLLVHTLDNPNPFGTSEYDRFGWAVAISGDHAIVCAWLEDEADGVTNSGKVYIYNVTSGALVKTLDNSNAYGTGKDDYFGYSVAISGSNIIVGAINEDDADGTNSGKAYIFSAIASAPAEESTGWTIDLSNVTYDSVSFGVNQDNDPMSIAFNNDGTKMYMMGSFHKNIHQYTLSTGFDLSTASADNVSFYVGSQDNSPMRLKFNTDGTKMYINGLQRNKVHQYSLGSGFDLSTASYDNVAFEIPEWNYGFTFNNDGTKMYSSSNALRQYSLSAGFDISTATYDNVNFDLSSQSHSAVDTYFNSDGTKMYILFAGGEDDVHQYTLTTGFDISTASYDNVMFSVGSEETNPTAICISSDGTKMYSVGASNDTVYQYSTGL